VVEIHERVRWPDGLLKFFAADDLTGLRDQNRQDLKGLLLKPDSHAALAQFSSAKIELEHPKTQPPVNLMIRIHRAWLGSRKRTTSPCRSASPAGGDSAR